MSNKSEEQNDFVAILDKLDESDDHFQLIKQYEAKILEPFNHLYENPHRFYDIIPKIFNGWLKIPQDKLEEITEIFHYVGDSIYM